MNHCFRLKVRVRTLIRLSDGPQTLNLTGFHPVEVRHLPRSPTVCTLDARATCPPSTHLRIDGERFTFTGRGYASEEEARNSGRRFSDALLVAGALRHLGIHVGYDRQSLRFSQDIIDRERAASGRELKGGMYGLVTYKKDTAKFVDMDAEGASLTTPRDVENFVNEWINEVHSMTERQRTCSSLINDALHAASPETAFVLCISSLEALCVQGQVDQEGQRLVDALLEALDREPASSARQALRDTVGRQRRQSVGAACRELVSRHLGEPKAATFSKLYALRSRFLHDGKGRGDLGSAATEARTLACQLLEQELRSARS